MLPRRGKIIDYINLIEEPLKEVISRLREKKSTVRIQGLLILPGRSCEIYVDLLDGTPTLAVLIEKGVELKGDVAWQEIVVSLENAAGFLEVYELKPEDVDEDLKLKPDAKIKVTAPIKIELPKVNPKIEKYSEKLSSNIVYKTAIIIHSIHLNARAERAATSASLSAVMSTEIAESIGATRYVIATLYGSKKWKSIEVLAKNGEVLASLIYKPDGVIHGKMALKIILNPALLGEYSSFDILIYDVKVDPIAILEEEIQEEKIREKLPKEEKEEIEVVTKETAPVKVEETKEITSLEEAQKYLDKVREKAEEYFREVLDTLGYELKEVKIKMTNKIEFQVKIKKKRFTLRRANMRIVKREIIDEARWIMEELRIKLPVEVEIEKI
ncbi:MAG: hypothetical protein DRJ20_02545 [Candidatus Methanomethylicota archaeon]|uniref:DUF2226 domain-containing protein n=1 Tax=Thermoproteota archaeon TaxID=2056631 RepID=A0A497EVU5_9CREN|nr:MAG: hypothetical protein DRJ20_02545 [Candidatus Verstraetearchaeota archaeon]